MNLYDDLVMLEELQEILTDCVKGINCPVCGADTQKQFDCKNCEIDHMDDKCYRQGKHDDDCLLMKHSALVDIEIDMLKKEGTK
jgi:hypothetical protein